MDDPVRDQLGMSDAAYLLRVNPVGPSMRDPVVDPRARLVPGLPVLEAVRVPLQAPSGRPVR